MMKKHLLPIALLAVTFMWSCKSKSVWPEADQKEFMDICEQAMYGAFDRDTNFSYCACMLEKIMDEYPDPEQQDEVSDDLILEFADACFDELGIKMP